MTERGRAGDAGNVGDGVFDPDDDDLFGGTTEKQRRILLAATEVFAERGFAGTPTAEIAKRAGVAEGTIFKHYKTKKDLLIGVVGPMLFRVVAPKQLESVRQIFAHPYERFDELVRALYVDRVDFLRAHKNAVRILVQEIAFHPELRALAQETVGAAILGEAAAAVRRFQARGQLVVAEPTSVVRLLMGTMITYAMVRFIALPDRAWDDDAEIELMIRFVTKGLAPDPTVP